MYLLIVPVLCFSYSWFYLGKAFRVSGLISRSAIYYTNVWRVSIICISLNYVNILTILIFPRYKDVNSCHFQFIYSKYNYLFLKFLLNFILLLNVRFMTLFKLVLVNNFIYWTHSSLLLKFILPYLIWYCYCKMVILSWFLFQIIG